jgi:hypothetical protein
VVKDSPPPVPEDRTVQQVRCLSAAQKKEEKDATKKRSKRKFLEREALNKHRHQQRLDDLPMEESPSETASEEEDDDDSDDDDAGCWAFLTSLPKVDLVF